MNQDADEPLSEAETLGAPKDLEGPILAEDLLLLLFQPNAGLRSGTGTTAGENTLLSTLAGAVSAGPRARRRGADRGGGAASSSTTKLLAGRMRALQVGHATAPPAAA
ncbi:hypothetical protein HNR25_003676 [Streptomonospora salina]|uniref:Uncharacterized protein n=1 Tax=Streptomonospora salina TaxID=104205 RepID=A0A841E9Y0_9ACTN|nr:hypothetical protein [Streptomonospora salina]MBB5999925.1 hypothetical protein [Streptomonospora salina]